MKFDLKKFLILNFPYALMFWFFNRVGEGYRLAAGADMVAKGMGAISGLGEIISLEILAIIQHNRIFYKFNSRSCTASGF